MKQPDNKGFWIISAVVAIMYLYATIPDSKATPSPTPAYNIVKTSAPNPPIPATRASNLIPIPTAAPSNTPRPLPSPTNTTLTLFEPLQISTAMASGDYAKLMATLTTPYTATPRPIATQRPAPTQPPAPTRGATTPSGYNCPATHPIKGNATSGIYHMPHHEYYTRTNPEQCFATEADALAANYRRAIK